MLRVVCCIFTLFFLSSCVVPNDYIEPEQRAVVTVLGVEKNGEGINLYLQLYNGEKYKQFGENLSEAVNIMQNKVEGKLLLSQCSVIFTDKTLLDIQIKDIFDFCIENQDISLSVKLINCDVKKLFEIDDKKIGETIYNKIYFSWGESDVINLGNCFEIINKSEYYLLNLKISDQEIILDGVNFYKQNKYIKNYSQYDFGK